jgi:Carboxypeptidase regulatory-like domain
MIRLYSVRPWPILRTFLVAASCALLAVAPASAQTVTTGSLAGTARDAQGGALPGVTITAVHTATGTKYETVTDAQGRFDILNVRVGAYDVVAELAGFRPQTLAGLEVALGERELVDVRLQVAAVTETVEVVASPSLIDSSVAGTGGNVSNAIKETLPTITRSLADMVRISPLFNSQGSGAGDGASVVSVAGTSFRYNALQIDGAANNDLFGLAGSAGAPGGAAETQPISLDAIQEIQLVVSPYDVRQGGFAGGGINAITKSGSNAVRGTAFYFGRNQSWVGDGADDRPISEFKDKQFGGSVGGPIVQNKAFFFGTADYARKLRPTGFSVNSGGQQFGNEADVNRVLSILQNRYGYSPGPDPLAEFGKATDSDKYFVRTDFNLGSNHQLTVRNNYISALNDVGFPSLSTWRFPDSFYRFNSKTNSTVGQLNSTFGKGVNELRLTYTRVRDNRGHAFDQEPFPAVTVVLTGSTTVVAGTESFSGRNELDQDIVEINDAFTLIKGRHVITLGTHNELLKVRNLFIRDAFGTYRFNSIDFLDQGLAQQYDRSFSATSDPMQSAAFKVNQWGLYAGDQWYVRPRVTLTYGIRMDAPQYPDKPNANPVAISSFGYATDVVPSDVQWSPRVGLNWSLNATNTAQFRAGVGVFTGRPAYVWISNQFGNTGIDFTRIGAGNNANNRIPFVADPLNQPTTVTGATAGTFNNEIDMIDPNFNYPSILRGNLGGDTRLPGGLIGTVDFVWSKTIQDIKYENLNLVQLSGVSGAGGRPFFARNRVSTVSDAILLENTDEGYSWNLAFEARRPFRNGFFASAGYSYGEAKSIMDGTSDQAASNWGNVYIPANPNDPPMVRSNFDPGHRITLSGAYDIPIIQEFKTTVSLFYSGQSGRPYTLTTGNDVNGDVRGTNDLLYIPASPDEFIYRNGTATATYQDFLGLIAADDCLAEYIGTIIPRNACRAPWTNTFDGRVAVQLPFKRVKAEVTLDMLNLINLFDSKSGLFEYMSFGQLSLYTPISSANNTTVTPTQPLIGYNLSSIMAPTFRKFLRDDLRSRWQLQLGGRIRF